MESQIDEDTYGPLNGADKCPSIHIILEYNPSPDFDREAPNTIRNHQEVIEAKGSVYWPKFSKSKRTRLYKDDVPPINKQIDDGHETHFYMYAPEHRELPRRLHVGRLCRIYFGDDKKVDKTKISGMYELLRFPVLYYFELSKIAEFAPDAESLAKSPEKYIPITVDEALRNLLIYPDITFLDLVSFISPQRVLEAEPKSFFD